jgi:HSP20 family protein
MSQERDLFANIERMRREVDELFGDVVGAMTRRGGFSPRLDVLFAKDPPRAIVQAELAGIDLSDLELQVRNLERLLGQRTLEVALLREKLGMPPTDDLD